MHNNTAITLGQGNSASDESVILAHGIINPWWVMAPIGRHLKRLGYRVIYWDYPSRNPVAAGSRFVMIGPPNNGCEIAEELYHHRIFRWAYGERAIRQLFASDKAFHEECGIPPIEFGIIAGGKGDVKGFYSGLGHDNDGTVTVASTRLQGARDFIILPHTHMGLLISKQVSRQVEHFLQEGNFTPFHNAKRTIDEKR